LLPDVLKPMPLEPAQSHARLIADHDQAQAQAREPRKTRGRAGGKAHAAPIHVVRHVGQQRAVLVQEYCRGQGHEVSFIGSTITSGITVWGGWVSTNLIAAATFPGSCSRSTSMSGKRSSRKGVRMPPAITAETLMPCERSSA